MGTIGSGRREALREKACVLSFALLFGTAGCGAAIEHNSLPTNVASRQDASAIGQTRPMLQPGSRAAMPEAVRGLRFLFVPAGDDPTSRKALDALRVQLERTGYDIVLEPNAPHDASFEARVAERAAGGCTEGCTQGQQQISLAMVRNEQAIDWLATSFSIERGESSARAAAERLVDQLSTSPRLATLPGIVAESTRQAWLARAAGATSPDDSRTRDDLAWNPAALRHCRNARGAEACEPLVAYLSAFPNGAHAAEAKATLDLNADRIARVRGRSSAR